MLRKTRLLLLVLILIPGISYAEIRIFTHTVNQPFGGSQSPDDARVAAMTKAKLEVLEKAGTYLETFTVVKNHKVEKDEILALAAAVLKAEIVSQKNYAKENAFGIIIKAKVEVDTSILDERVKEILQDRSLLDKYKDNQKREKELLARIKELERENQKLKGLPQKEQKQKRETIKNQFKIATQGLTASELFNKASALLTDVGKNTDPDRAIVYLSEAIRLDSKFALAYSSRGNAWRSKGNHDRAISDFDKAIELNPGYYGYFFRGAAWFFKSNYDRAISDFDKAIELNPKYADAYYLRGYAWSKKNSYDQAISDFDKAIELKPKNAGAYYLRGTVWGIKDNDDRAISDFDKAIELNPRHANAYISRGFTWAIKGNYDRACHDFQKACELGNCRGINWAREKGYCK